MKTCRITEMLEEYVKSREGDELDVKLKNAKGMLWSIETQGLEVVAEMMLYVAVRDNYKVPKTYKK